MKKILTLVAALFILVAANQAQTLRSLFDKYSEDERFSYVTVGNGMMNFASKFGHQDKNSKDVMSKMKSVKILTLNDQANSAIMKTVLNELDKVVESGNFETAVEARDKGERVHIYYRITGNDNADMLIVSKDKGEFSLIWISGKMTKEEMMHTFSSNGKVSNPAEKPENPAS